MWNRIKAWWAAEGAMVGLQGVPDRMLEDMGLQRDGMRDRVLGRDIPVDTAAENAPDRREVGLDDLRCVYRDA
jgi:hypothetical protein